MDLHVSIPKRFKEQLTRRFTPSEVSKFTNAINSPAGGPLCPLCDFYQSGTYADPCRGCPFDKFIPSHSGALGCWKWIEKVISEPSLHFYFTAWSGNEITWHPKESEQARRQLAKLRERAKELITWIE